MGLPFNFKQLREGKILNDKLTKSDHLVIIVLIVFMVIGLLYYGKWLIYKILTQLAYSAIPEGFQHIRCSIEESKLKDCLICLDGSQYVDFLEAPCGHEFHRKCLNKWLQESETCPVCRQKYDL